MESRGIVQLMMTWEGQLVIVWSNCPIVQSPPGDQHIGQHRVWFHNLLLVARDCGELCPLLCCLAVSRELPTWQTGRLAAAGHCATDREPCRADGG